MHEQHLFEYAVIRIVPRVEREEFINVGVILFCQSRGFLQAVHHIDIERLKAFSPKADHVEIIGYLDAIGKICEGSQPGGAIATLGRASRFRWLTATRSSVIQCSKVHPGFCADPAVTLEKLLAELVF
jgi:hypothetical protein